MSYDEETAVGLIANIGGMRGMQIVRHMQNIEEATHQPIALSVDLMALLSTGSVGGAIVNVPDPSRPGMPLYPARFGVMSYYNLGETVFEPRRFETLHQAFGHARHDERPYERHLDKILRDTRVRDCVTSVMYYAIDVGTEQAVCIKHIKDRNGKTIDENLSDMFLKHVVRGGTTLHAIHPVGTFPTNPGSPNSRMISLQDPAAASGNVPHEVWHTLGMMRPGARRIIINLDTSSVAVEGMTAEKFNTGGLSGYFLNQAKREHFYRTTFNAPVRASIKFLQSVMGKDLYDVHGTTDPANPRHPTPHTTDGRKSNMRKHIAFADAIKRNPETRFNEMCQLLSRRHEIPPAEKSGVFPSSRPPPPSANDDGSGNLILLPGALRR